MTATSGGAGRLARAARAARLVLLAAAAAAALGSPRPSAAAVCVELSTPPCTADGAPPIVTVPPVTRPLICEDGRSLSFDQNGIARYACFNLPKQATHADGSGKKWPLVVYLHGSLVTPESLYTLGRSLFDLRDTASLSGDAGVRGFAILSPEGRHAQPWPSSGFETGCGFHWDEWNRDPTGNLDALAIDRFIDEAVATGLIDARRIYVFGWSNGAYMAALYGIWRSDRIAAIGQYAGADPFSRTPCPVAFDYARKVPIVLLRNACDALVPCAATNAWIATLEAESWPLAFHTLDVLGKSTSTSMECAAECSEIEGVFEHVRWPSSTVFQTTMLNFFRQHPLP